MYIGLVSMIIPEFVQPRNVHKSDIHGGQTVAARYLLMQR